MNFGTVSLAAPQAASSRVPRYPRTDRRVLATASQSHHQTRRQSAACWHRQQSSWHRQQRPSHQPTLLPCSVAPRSRTVCAADRNRGSGHAYSWRRSSGPAPRRRGRAGRTSGRSPSASTAEFFNTICSEANIAHHRSHVRKVPILLQKSFRGGKRTFLEPPMRFTERLLFPT
jgi:hypothetical protein